MNAFYNILKRFAGMKLWLGGFVVAICLAVTAPASANGLPGSFTSIDSRPMMSVVTLRNPTKAPVHYEIKWPGGEWKSFTVEPSRAKLQWFKGQDVRAQVRFDHSFEPGFQEKIVTVMGRDHLVSAGNPSRTGDGLVYSFHVTRNGGGLVLNTATPLDKTLMP